MNKYKFDNLLVLGRPAAGKSELIDFLKKTSDTDRVIKFHIGKFEEVDDFPWLWDIFMEDDKREKEGKRRLYSELENDGHVVTIPKFRGNLIPKFNEKISQKLMNDRSFYDSGTFLIEFARGKPDPFKDSIWRLSPEILKRAAILFIKVSFEESYRKNDARFKKDEAGSILFHKVADRDMYGFFKENDWDEITGGKESGILNVSGINVPFISMPNEPELKKEAELELRYKTALDKLFEMYKKDQRQQTAD